MAGTVRIDLDDKQAVENLKNIGEEFLRTGVKADNLSDSSQRLLNELESRAAQRGANHIRGLADEIERTTGKTKGMQQVFEKLRPVLANTFGGVVNDLNDFRELSDVIRANLGGVGKSVKEAASSWDGFKGAAAGAGGAASAWLGKAAAGAAVLTTGILGIATGIGAVIAILISGKTIIEEINKTTADVGENSNSWAQTIRGLVVDLKEAEGHAKELADTTAHYAEIAKRMEEENSIARRNIVLAAKEQAEEDAQIAARKAASDALVLDRATNRTAAEAKAAAGRMKSIDELAREERRLNAELDALSAKNELTAEKRAETEAKINAIVERRTAIEQEVTQAAGQAASVAENDRQARQAAAKEQFDAMTAQIALEYRRAKELREKAEESGAVSKREIDRLRRDEDALARRRLDQADRLRDEEEDAHRKRLKEIADIADAKQKADDAEKTRRQAMADAMDARFAKEQAAIDRLKGIVNQQEGGPFQQAAANLAKAAADPRAVAERLAKNRATGVNAQFDKQKADIDRQFKQNDEADQWDGRDPEAFMALQRNRQDIQRQQRTVERDRRNALAKNRTGAFRDAKDNVPTDEEAAATDQILQENIGNLKENGNLSKQSAALIGQMAAELLQSRQDNAQVAAALNRIEAALGAPPGRAPARGPLGGR